MLLLKVPIKKIKKPKDKNPNETCIQYRHNKDMIIHAGSMAEGSKSCNVGRK